MSDHFMWYCPIHQSPLADSGQALICEEGCSYPQVNGIQRFVSADNYSAAFGSQWKHYRVTQLDSYTGVPISRSRLARCLGDALWADALYDHVKPGGWLVFDHYTYNWLYYTKMAPYFRMLFRRLSPERSLRWSEYLVDALLPLHRRMQNTRRLHSLFSRFSPVLCYYRSYPELNDQLQREWALLDTHDALTDWYKHFRIRGQIEHALNALGVSDVACSYGGIGIEARARRPVAL
jgi:hypothetical protein